jgi:hypothetical protein
MSRPPHSPWFYLPNDILGWVKIMKLLIVQLPPFSCYFIPLRSKFSSESCSQTPSVYALPVMWETKWQNYGFVYFNLYISGQQVGRQKTLDRMVASIRRI